MQTEIQFLLEIILDTKTTEEAQKKCRRRIKLIQTPYTPIRTMPQLAQAPSTLAALERQTGEPVSIPTCAIPKTPAAAAALQQRQQIIDEALSGKVSINNGDGTKGKRKF